MMVSVVIPSFNHSEYVLASIESVLNQELPDVDLIVIDDGSSDGSAELIEDHCRRVGGYRFVQRENRGLIETLNQGLDMARGRYFCELASDDYFPPDSLGKRVGFFENNPDHVAVFADGFSVYGTKQTESRFLDEKRKQLFRQEDPIPDLLHGVLPVFATGLFVTSVLRELGGFDRNCFRYYEDLEMPVSLCLAGKVGYLDEPVLYRREHDSNTSRVTNHVRGEKVLCFEKFRQDEALGPYRPMIDYRLRREYLALGRYLRNGGGTVKEKGIFRGAWPFVWRDPRLLWYLFAVK